MIKVFASDMDGTLLNENHVISDRTADAIRRLQDHGIEFMVATGRSFNTAQPLLDVHDLSCHMVNMNGAVLSDPQGHPLFEKGLDYQTSRDILDYLIQNKINYSIMTTSRIYLTNYLQRQKRLTKFIQDIKTKKKNHQVPSEISQVQLIASDKIIRPIKEFQVQADNTPMKIMVLTDDEETQTDFIAHFGPNKNLDITSSAIDNLEVTHKKAQKGLALQAYLKDKGITMDQVAAIGDSLNDRSMMRMARYSFAMENALDEVKKIAKYTAPANSQDGVAQVIDQIIQGEFD